MKHRVGPLAAVSIVALCDGSTASAQPQSLAWTIVQSLTTEVGPRLAGTPAEAHARRWAVSLFQKLGLQDVRQETASMPLWSRGAEHAEVVGPFAQPLAVTAIGRSGATGPEGLEAELVYFPTIDALRQAPPEKVKGRIAFVSHAMQRANDESQYAAFAEVRRAAPAIAAQKGAQAVLIRSLGTDHHRMPHTGLTMWGDTKPIPAGAVSVPDAETVERIVRLGGPVRLKLLLTPRAGGTGTTGNVIGEIRGREHPEEIVLLGAHLDSWDLGQGAEDDGAGVAIVTAAAKRILDRGTMPRRTIRIVLFGCEEMGLSGANAYAKAHGAEHHVVAIEMDHGSGPVQQLASNVAAASRPIVERLARSLASRGVVLGPNDARLGTDLNPLLDLKVPTLSLHQQGFSYFDVHHTADDTLDKVDPAGLDQAAEVLSEVAWSIADGDDTF